MRCIYCLQPTEPGYEHVIPRSLGTFDQNLTLAEVCGICNGEFSKLETIFKEDSFEGFLAAQYQLKSSSSARLRKKRCQVSFQLGSDEMFERLLPVLDKKTGQATPIEQIVIEGVDGRLQVLWAGGLEKKDFKKRLKWSGKNPKFYIFAKTEERLQELTDRLRELGVQFEEKHRAVISDEAKKQQIEVSIDSRIDRTISRLVAKIAFNYLAFCAFASGCGELLYGQSFDSLRAFILKDDGPNPVSVEAGMTTEEHQDNQYLPFHFVEITETLSSVIGTVSLFGYLKYVVRLGTPCLYALKRGTVAVRHVFDLGARRYFRAYTENDCPAEHGQYFIFCPSCPSFLMDLQEDWRNLGGPEITQRLDANGQPVDTTSMLERLSFHTPRHFGSIVETAKKRDVSLVPPYRVRLTALDDLSAKLVEMNSGFEWIVPLDAESKKRIDHANE